MLTENIERTNSVVLSMPYLRNEKRIVMKVIAGYPVLESIIVQVRSYEIH